jgi:plasmid stabilization system protein ParE
LFRPGRAPGTREIVAHRSHIVVYRVELACIEVLRVVHARQEYP